MNLEAIQQQTLIRIVDDDADLRDTCEMMLSYAGWQVKTYPDAKSFLTGDAPSVPGCLILDIRMPGMTGTELLTEMNHRGYLLPVIMLTGHATVDIAVASLKMGAIEFLQKPVNEEQLIAAITQSADDSLRICRGLPTDKELRKRLAQLSEREKEVLALMVQKVPAKAIAERLGISDKTAYEHRSEIYRKLGTKDLTALFSNS